MSQAKAGSYQGSFIVRRGMTGREAWKRGDTREGDTVAEVRHLLVSGALAPADAKTAEAVSEFLGVEAKKGEPIDAAAMDPASRGVRPVTLTELRGGRLEAQAGRLPSTDGPAATMRQSEKALRAIAKREGVTVETDDNKADLVRKIAESRATKAEADAKNKAEAPADANKSEA
jgi:hypothetical protein